MSAEELTTGSRSAVTPDPGARSARFVATGTRGEAVTSTIITAEIPAVPLGPKYGVLLPDGTIWYPGSRKKLPGPLPLRILVWALAFLVLLAGAGLFILRTHPAWVDPLRRKVPATAPSLQPFPTGSRTGSHRHRHVATTSLSEESPQPSGIPGQTTVYRLTGVTRYTVAVTTTAVTYVQAFQLVNGVAAGPALFAQDVPAGTTQDISASGPVDVEVAAAGSTVSVLSGGRRVGTVATPPYVPWNFWFEPAK